MSPIPLTLRWLADRPEVEIVSRDRGGGYGQAVARAAPDVVQVADRWRLIENASRAFLDVVRRSMIPIRRALGAGAVNPELLTSAERLQHAGFMRCEAMYKSVRALAGEGVSDHPPAQRSRGFRKRLFR